MVNNSITRLSSSYIFENAGGMRDQLEQTILNELKEKEYPLKATISTLKSGKGLAGALFGSKDQCIVITIDDEAQIAITNTTVGTYLYVGLYYMYQRKPMSLTGFAAAIGDIFKIQYRDAVRLAAIQATESAFGKLGLKQCNSGYHSEKLDSDNLEESN